MNMVASSKNEYSLTPISLLELDSETDTEDESSSSVVSSSVSSSLSFAFGE